LTALLVLVLVLLVLVLVLLVLVLVLLVLVLLLQRGRCRRCLQELAQPSRICHCDLTQSCCCILLVLVLLRGRSCRRCRGQ
jgi:hypothetical protein